MHSLYRPGSYLTGDYWDEFLVLPFAARASRRGRWRSSATRPARRHARSGATSPTRGRCSRDRLRADPAGPPLVRPAQPAHEACTTRTRGRTCAARMSATTRSWSTSTASRTSRSTWRRASSSSWRATGCGRAASVIVNVGHPEGQQELEQVLGATMADVFGTVCAIPSRTPTRCSSATERAAVERRDCAARRYRAGPPICAPAAASPPAASRPRLAGRHRLHGRQGAGRVAGGQVDPGVRCGRRVTDEGGRDEGNGRRRFEGRVVVVTGGGSGLGEAMSKAFAAEGGRVAVADIREEGAAKVAEAADGEARGYACDVSDSAAVREAVRARWPSDLGDVDVLVNNAGIARRNQETQESMLEQMQATMAGGERESLGATQGAERRGVGPHDPGPPLRDVLLHARGAQGDGAKPPRRDPEHLVRRGAPGTAGRARLLGRKGRDHRHHAQRGAGGQRLRHPRERDRAGLDPHADGAGGDRPAAAADPAGAGAARRNGRARAHRGARAAPVLGRGGLHDGPGRQPERRAAQLRAIEAPPRGQRMGGGVPSALAGSAGSHSHTRQAWRNAERANSSATAWGSALGADLVPVEHVQAKGLLPAGSRRREGCACSNPSGAGCA